MQTPVQVTDQELQALFDEPTYRLGRSDARSAAVGDVRVEGERVRGAVQGNRPRPFELWVRRDGERIVSQCNCSDWAGARRHCRHVAALLYTLINEQAEAPTASTGQAAAPLTSWLLDQGPNRVPLQLYYVVTLDATSVSVSRRRSDQTTDASDSEFARFSSEDQRIAEVLSSLPRDERGVCVRVDRRRAGDLLAILRGRAVFLDDRKQLPLGFSDAPLGLRISGHAPSRPGEPFRFTAVLSPRGEERAFRPGAVQLLGGLDRYGIADDVAYPLDARLTLAALERFQANGQVEVKPEELTRTFGEWLPRLADGLGATVPPAEALIRVHSAAPELTLASTGDLLHVEARLLAEYGTGAQPIDLTSDDLGSDLEIQFDAQGVPFGIRRDRAAEVAALALLESLGLSRGETGYGAEGPAALSFWSRGVHRLPPTWRTQLPPSLVGLRVRHQALSPTLSIRRSATGWFEVDLRLLSEGIEVDPSQFGVEAWGDFVTLRDGSVAPVDAAAVDPVLAALADLRGLLPQGKGQLPPWLAGPLAELVAAVGSGVDIDGPAQTLLRGLAGDPPPMEALPKGLKAELRPYQQVGYRWLCFLKDVGQGGMGALLADEMGLGKTVQALAFLLREKEQSGEKHAPALVVTPTSVLPNWIREAERFAPALRSVDFSGGGRKLPADGDCDLIVTSYAILRRDIEILQGRRFSAVILDEAQNIKNPQSVTARAAYAVQADFRVALTGTPIENRPLDLWSIFHYLAPELLGTQQEFSLSYETLGGAEPERAHARLASRIRPFLRRRLKRDVLSELPDKQESEMVSELTPVQKKLYLSVLKEVRREVLGAIETQGVARSQLNILAGLLRLRQVACDPRLLKREDKFTDEDSSKLLLWQELLEEAIEGGHRVVCFSQFVEMLKLMKAVLEKAGIRYEYLDGKTRERQEVIDRFNAKDGSAAPVFLISLKAGGTGLNLATADTVFIYDPWWNPAVEDQAIDRVHRIGQGREVTVYRLLASGTVEEKILELKKKKREMSARLVAGDSAASPTFTAAEVEELLRAG